MIIDLSLWGCQITGLGARHVCVKEQRDTRSVHGERYPRACTHAIGDQAETVVCGLAAREMVPLRNVPREMIRGMLSRITREQRRFITRSRDHAEFTAGHESDAVSARAAAIASSRVGGSLSESFPRRGSPGNEREVEREERTLDISE
jgi:hypothetical protein